VGIPGSIGSLAAMEHCVTCSRITNPEMPARRLCLLEERRAGDSMRGQKILSLRVQNAAKLLGSRRSRIRRCEDWGAEG
jgi:hypothetical protein